ncbi:unnamed protein product [Trypanosoma congolense IL3000]|uniref:WGS project CAEQ00000000 data, annotated contig 215 n=1 Tax=Trypanosoma congolense (strain IL3000) TaxID=1068625 RepID=F9WBV5_TRYCI|nr:unnamed protein product [Trypanosoma congolense IL3000]
MASPRAQVVVVGVWGCSASGKSIIASQLSSMLESPLLPLTMDSFFDEGECERLGVWEDPRCLRAGDFIQCLANIRSMLELYGPTDAPLHEIKEVTQFLHFTPDVAAVPTPAHGRVYDNIGLARDLASQNCSREAATFSTSPLCVSNGVIGSDSTGGAGDELPKVFVVCEGFLLFAYPGLCQLIDCFIFVDSDNEVACMRRFFRGSRRKKGDGRDGYYERILRMRVSRANAKRRADEVVPLCETLPPLFPLVLPKLDYLPPLPSTPGDYRQFWLQHEYKDAPPPTPFGCNSFDDAPYEWLEVKDVDYIHRRLHQWVSTAHTIDFEKASVRYFEFRYWFFYEVLFYHYQLRAICQKNVLTACEQRASQGATNFPIVLHLSNDADTSYEVLRHQISLLVCRVRESNINKGEECY